MPTLFQLRSKLHLAIPPLWAYFIAISARKMLQGIRPLPETYFLS